MWPPPRPPHRQGQRGEVQRARAGGHGQAGPWHRPQHLSEEAAGLRGHRQKGGGRPLQDCPHQEHRQGCAEGDPQEHSSVFILLNNNTANRQYSLYSYGIYIFSYITTLDPY